jgi:hypothetical protein
VNRAIALLVFDHGFDPDKVEAMTVSRMNNYIRLAVDLHKEREKQRGSK